MQQQEHDRGAGGACRPKKKNPSSTRANRLLDSTGGAGVGGDAARIARRVAAATGAGRPGVAVAIPLLLDPLGFLPPPGRDRATGAGRAGVTYPSSSSSSGISWPAMAKSAGRPGSRWRGI